MSRPRVCLAMMVKNEAHIIERALRSARPLIDTWVIVDTGSTDDTRCVIERTLADVPGEVVTRPWQDFGTNRTQTLELARTRGDYALVLDADDELVYPAGARFPDLDMDGYLFAIDDGGARYRRLQLLRSARPWRYDGVLHEHAECEGRGPLGFIEGIVYVRHPDGARTRDPGKYLKDAATLLGELAKHPDDPRTVFYLAQSFREAGVPDEALIHYQKRVTLGGFPEEVYLAQLWIGRIRAHLGAPKAELMEEMLRTYAMRPTRHEALVDLAELARKTGDPALAHVFASRAVSLPPTTDSLFVEVAAETWRPRDELAQAALALGRFEESAQLNRELIDDAHVPELQKPRMREALAIAQRNK